MVLPCSFRVDPCLVVSDPPINVWVVRIASIVKINKVTFDLEFKTKTLIRFIERKRKVRRLPSYHRSSKGSKDLHTRFMLSELQLSCRNTNVWNFIIIFMNTLFCFFNAVSI